MGTTEGNQKIEAGEPTIKHVEHVLEIAENKYPDYGYVINIEIEGKNFALVVEYIPNKIILGEESLVTQVAVLDCDYVKYNMTTFLSNLLEIVKPRAMKLTLTESQKGSVSRHECIWKKGRDFHTSPEDVDRQMRATGEMISRYFSPKNGPLDQD